MPNVPTPYTPDQLRELDPASLIEIILKQGEQIGAFVTEIQALRDQLAKNSQNSGKPPSSDGLKKARRQSLREKGKRSSGGQVGHTGQTLTAVAAPDAIITHPVEQCRGCGADLRSTEVESVEARQVFELPVVQLTVTEHRAEHKCCPVCGETTVAPFPAGVDQPVQYGAGFKAQAIYLSSYQLLPLARTCDVLGELYGQRPSEGMVIAAQTTCAEQVQPTLTQIKADLTSAAVANCDESGVRVEGQLNWLHVMGTADLTYYTVQAKRGQDGMQAMGILPDFVGRAVHDAWSAYFTFKDCQHALCNAHQLRELKFIFDQYHQPWAQAMTELLLSIKHAVDTAPPERTRLDLQALMEYEQRYTTIVLQGLAANPPPETPPIPKRGRTAQSPPKNLLDRLSRYQAETLAFMYDFRIPFDNNLAERDIRMLKVQQKISGSFRTRLGADTFCAIRSYLSTVRKQGGNVIQAIYDALLGTPFMPASQPTP